MKILDGNEEAEETPEFDPLTQLLAEVSEQMKLAYQIHGAKLVREKLRHSLPFVTNPEERQRRLAVIQELAVAKDKALAEDLRLNFSLDSVDTAIDHIISGNWKGLDNVAYHFSCSPLEVHRTITAILRRALDHLPSKVEEMTVLGGDPSV